MDIKTTPKKTKKTVKNINKIVDTSKVWVVLNIDKNGFHYQSSQKEDGLILMALAMASNNNDWEMVKEYVDSIRYNGPIAELNGSAKPNSRLGNKC